MRFEISRECIRVIPENDLDEAYLEEVLDLRKNGSTCVAERVDGLNLRSWAYVRISKGGG